ncbi:hypothetical protein LJR241_000170 [Paraburkholderia hospita]|jgi:hypothetical protein
MFGFVGTAIARQNSTLRVEYRRLHLQTPVQAMKRSRIRIARAFRFAQMFLSTEIRGGGDARFDDARLRKEHRQRHDTPGDLVTAATYRLPPHAWSTARYGLLING